ncbi:aldo/keto reductase [Spirochaeta cellobiosiphila]|uniref:aldo/keto reductase n=1 Tax=Spirochaeta cellobiosiphila TaxID=504483 RepID=UPI000490105F|nr:aldo/keto reductase [Spirochaeta cellobiosiphila]
MRDNTYTLANGVKIPRLGLGTYLIKDGKESTTAVRVALEAGYRHIDTASLYKNEKGVGQGIRESGVPREDIFLVSKVWNTDQGYEHTKKAFRESLERLGTDYLDLYLIHWPKQASPETWLAMEELYNEGRIKSIGVSNFTPLQLEELLKTTNIVPMVNQVELHPQFPQYQLQEYCKSRNIQIESWGPLMQGRIFQSAIAQEVAAKNDMTVAQLAILWQWQQGNVALVKSTNPQRIRDNFVIPDKELSTEDLKLLKSMEGLRLGPDPENFDF